MGLSVAASGDRRASRWPSSVRTGDDSRSNGCGRDTHAFLQAARNPVRVGDRRCGHVCHGSSDSAALVRPSLELATVGVHLNRLCYRIGSIPGLLVRVATLLRP